MQKAEPGLLGLVLQNWNSCSRFQHRVHKVGSPDREDSPPRFPLPSNPRRESFVQKLLLVSRRRVLGARWSPRFLDQMPRQDLGHSVHRGHHQLGSESTQGFSRYWTIWENPAPKSGIRRSTAPKNLSSPTLPFLDLIKRSVSHKSFIPPKYRHPFWGHIGLSRKRCNCTVTSQAIASAHSRIIEKLGPSKYSGSLFRGLVIQALVDRRAVHRS
ncbi:MAG: hypothetical protein Ct9H300mP15_13940 [Gemmatimonadota bacterium]|nr:MAG: hypothetical protein Ct9H300mP15_13940 [Gemmatimonadota bacterium]